MTWDQLTENQWAATKYRGAYADRDTPRELAVVALLLAILAWMVL